MKLMIIGLGQCGSRIADELVRLNRQAESHRHTSIITGAFAVNTDQADLTGLSYIGSDYMHRILIGGRKTWGHGVGKVNEMGAELAREDGDKVIDAIRTAPDFYHTHAFLLIAGSAGGTGSGAISIISQMLKERYIGKPVYALVVLPFEHEEVAELRSVYNTATCLKSIHPIADGVFLADNQRYVRKDASMAMNLQKINRQIIEPFYDLMCAGEVTKYKYVGAKTLDAGDIIQSIDGWTALGVGRAAISRGFRSPWELAKTSFREKSGETLRAMQAMDAAVSELSIGVSPEDAGRALYLVSAPAREMSMDIAKGLGDYLREMAENAVIRAGDFPGDGGTVDVTIMFSQLAFVQKIMDYYDRASAFAVSQKERIKETTGRLRDMEDAAKGLPSLI
ncbi:MAG TPA: cell division protein FtsZ [Dehalococcoidia bacterium]|nr:cell division protein FtsZ [Dehalococcoidia bacterium]